MTQVSQAPWGEVPGQGSVHLWLLESPQLKVEILTLGATIKSVLSRGRDGRRADVVLGYDTLQGKVAQVTLVTLVNLVTQVIQVTLVT